MQFAVETVIRTDITACPDRRRLKKAARNIALCTKVSQTGGVDAAAQENICPTLNDRSLDKAVNDDVPGRLDLGAAADVSPDIGISVYIQVITNCVPRSWMRPSIAAI